MCDNEKENEQEQERRSQFGSFEQTGRVEQVRAFSDESLLYAYDQLHSPTLIPSSWIEILEAEIRRRGLRMIS